MILDITITNEVASSFFRFRGIFRIFKVAMLVKKLDYLHKNEHSKNKSEIDYSDFKSPLERTMEILTNLKECLEDQKYIRDLNYCLKHISNGKIFTINYSVI